MTEDKTEARGRPGAPPALGFDEEEAGATVSPSPERVRLGEVRGGDDVGEV